MLTFLLRSRDSRVARRLRKFGFDQAVHAEGRRLFDQAIALDLDGAPPRSAAQHAAAVSVAEAALADGYVERSGIAQSAIDEPRLLRMLGLSMKSSEGALGSESGASEVENIFEKKLASDATGRSAVPIKRPKANDTGAGGPVVNYGRR